MSEEEKIFCSDKSVCGGKGFAWRSEVEQDTDFVCLSCQKVKFSIDIMDFLRTKMGHTKKATGDEFRFAVRELVQNADDCNAKIITIRLDDDALYVANDGYAFRPPDKRRGWAGDYVRICRVLSRPKAREAETTGAHGSGFQTVYCFTNHPEVHSAGISAWMNPTAPDEGSRINEMLPTNKAKGKSPYHRKGVLFRFPWRTNKEAKRAYEGERPFLDQDWPRWTPQRIEKMVVELRDYLHDLILCCQNLNVIRLVWGNPARAYQVQRVGFSLGSVPNHSYTAQIEEGYVRIPKDWERSFRLEKSKWQEKTSPKGGWPYIIGSSFVTDESGMRIYCGEDDDGGRIVTPELENLSMDENDPSGRRIILKGNIHVLLPLFDTEHRIENRPYYYRYSVLPIPYIGSNRFACSAHVIVDEDRSSLRLGDEAQARWFRMVMASMKRLYLNLFTEYLELVNGAKAKSNQKQRLIMNAIPGGPLHSWMNPKHEMEGLLADEQTDLIEQLVNMRILYSDEMLISPMDAYWVRKPEDRRLIKKLGGDVFADDFTEHPHFKIIEDELMDCDFEGREFLTLWREFKIENSVEGHLSLGQKLSNGGTLDTELVNGLIRFCLGSHDDEIRVLSIIPDKRGLLRSILNLYTVPKRFKSLLPLLDMDRRIHDDFRDIVESLHTIDAGPNDTIRELSNAVNAQKERFADLSSEDHRLVADLVARAVIDNSFALDDVKDCSFIPYMIQDVVRIGEPNKDDDGNLLGYSTQTHIGEEYRQSHIFKELERKVPGLTDEIERGINRLSLPGIGEERIAKVEKKLRFVALFEKKRAQGPTNFARVYISPKEGSLFEDENLRRFLIEQSGLKGQVVTKTMLVAQKKSLLEAVRAYFLPGRTGESGLTRNHMKDVPCLYNPNGDWFRAGDFAIEIDETSKMLGKHPLHKDFLDGKWDKEVLVNRLGVSEFPEPGDVVGAISRYAGKNINKNRGKLTDILEYLLFSKVELVDENKVAFAGRPEIRDLEWIPIKNGGFASAEHCLLPTQDNTEIMGEDYERMVDLSSEKVERARSEGVESQAIAVGIRAKPNAEDMLRVVKACFDQGNRPPLNIFDELSRLSGVPKDIIKDTDINAKAYYDYGEGKWWQEEEIKISNISNVPISLGEHYCIVNTNHTHSSYLRTFLDVQGEISDGDVLEFMVSGAADIDMGLWSFLLEMDKRAVNLKKKYGSSTIFPNPDDPEGLMRPDRIVLRDHKTFKDTGMWGDWLVLDRHHHILGKGLLEYLKKLGAREPKELDNDDVREILESVAKTSGKYGYTSYEKMMRLLLWLAGRSMKGEIVRLKRPCAPVRTADGFEVKRISDCYMNDTSKPSLFRGKLPILDFYVEGEYRADLRDLYEYNGASPLSMELDVRPHRRPSQGREDRLQTTRFHELRKALCAFFEEGITDEEDRKVLRDGVSWLNSCKVFMYNDIQVEFSVGGISESTSGFDLEHGEKGCTINIAEVGTSGTMRQLAEEVFESSIGAAASEEIVRMKPQMISIIASLLSSDLTEWEYYIGAYRFDGKEIPLPLMELVEFTTKGYYDTKMKLKSSYNACQICKKRTPADESGIESCENITSVISMRGGRYWGAFKEYSPANCLFLCPIHQTLYRRGLVKIPYLEMMQGGDMEGAIKKVGDTRARIKERIKNGEYPKDRIIPDVWEVFEAPAEDFETNESQWRYVPEEISFRVEHYLEFLEWMSTYLGRRRP